MTILSNLLRRSVENPLLPLTSNALVTVLGGSTTHSGVSVNQTTAPTKYIALYRAITLVSGAIAGLPFEAHRTGVKREPFASELLNNPNPDMSRIEVWEWLLAGLLSAGHGFALKGRDRNDRVATLDPVAPDRVRVRRVPRTASNPEGKEFDLRQDNGSHKTLTAFDMLHIPGPLGLSPIGVASQSIGSSIAAEEYTGRLWASGTLMSGVLQTEQKLEQPQADALKQRWQAKVAGIAHAHEIAVLDSGAKYQPISISPSDAQLIESKKFGVLEIARLYGVPPHLLAEVERSTSWGTGIEQQSIGFVVFTLRPWLIRVEQRISKECLPPGVEAHFHTDPLTSGDAKTRYEAHAQAIQNGIKTRNQVRIEENLPPSEDPDADEYLVPLNLRPASQALTLKDRTDIATALVRAAYDPIDALKLAGLDPIKHLGLLPVTVQPEDEPVDTAPLDEFRAAIVARLDALASKDWTPVVNVHPSNVNVTTPDVRVESPITVQPAEVNVPAPEVRIEQPARRTVRKDVEHDERGRITRVIETEE